METVTVWHNRVPLLVYSDIAAKFGLSNGQQIQDSALHAQIIEENTNQSRAACSIDAAATGETCVICSA